MATIRDTALGAMLFWGALGAAIGNAARFYGLDAVLWVPAHMGLLERYATPENVQIYNAFGESLLVRVIFLAVGVVAGLFIGYVIKRPRRFWVCAIAAILFIGVAAWYFLMEVRVELPKPFPPM